MNQQPIKKNSPTIMLNTFTWSKDSHGLFDYQDLEKYEKNQFEKNCYSEQFEKSQFKISNEVKIYRTNNGIILKTKEEIPKNNTHESEFQLQILQDTQSKDNFFIKADQSSQQNTVSLRNPYPNIYMIVRSLKEIDGITQRGYAVTAGDVIKLGRVEYRVIETQNGVNNSSVNKVAEVNKDDLFFDANNQIIPKTENLICRYCLCEDCSPDKNSVDNQLLFPCKCTGSSGGVHYFCLRTWMQHKIVSETKNITTTYQQKKLECEVCKEPLPRMIKYNDEFHELITVKKPTNPYIMLGKISKDDEEYPNSNDQESSTLNLIVPPNQEPIKIGRGFQCDLRVTDISISRVHALIKYKDGKFLLFDNESKFGTLILLNKNHQIQNEKTAIQIGRTVFKFKLNRKQNQIPINSKRELEIVSMNTKSIINIEFLERERSTQKKLWLSGLDNKNINDKKKIPDSQTSRRHIKINNIFKQ